MKSSLTPDEIREAKTVFTAYMEFLDREKEMKEEKKAIKEQLVQLLEVPHLHFSTPKNESIWVND